MPALRWVEAETFNNKGVYFASGP
ncbi:Protein of unknown function [Propionibacterium freudenreichii]|nr:Protein of unknown function [Propionibacterium freudenreichii]